MLKQKTTDVLGKLYPNSQTSQNTENVLHLANNSSLDDKFSKVRPFFD